MSILLVVRLRGLVRFSQNPLAYDLRERAIIVIAFVHLSLFTGVSPWFCWPLCSANVDDRSCWRFYAETHSLILIRKEASMWKHTASELERPLVTPQTVGLLLRLKIAPGSISIIVRTCSFQ